MYAISAFRKKLAGEVCLMLIMCIYNYIDLVCPLWDNLVLELEKAGFESR